MRRPAPTEEHERMSTAPEVVDELSVYVLPGRVTDPSVALREAKDAERAGFSRVWLSERYDLKDVGVLSGAIAATTERLGIATGLVPIAARHPIVLATYAATMQATFGERLALGLAKGIPPIYEPHGMISPGLRWIEDFVGILRKLWAGEAVTYDGPVGRFPNMKMADLPKERPPPVYYGSFGGPKALEMVARAFDGVLLFPFLTVEAVAESVATLRKAAERAGRDPRSLRVVHTVVTAPSLPEEETLAVVHARALTYLQVKGLGELLLRQNHWDAAKLEPARNHPLFTGMRTAAAEQSFHRSQMVDAASLLPEEWIRSSAGIGTPDEIVALLRRYFEAGVDEVVLHGSSPAQNAPVLDAWRRSRGSR
jgi:5,10-methylenetetrahydromethanopterin reductase